MLAMDSQTKLTDYFVSSKRKVSTKLKDNLIAKNSLTRETSPKLLDAKTPKRKLISKEKSNSSKRKKTPSNEVIIDIKNKTTNSESKVVTQSPKSEEQSKPQMTAEEVKKKLGKCRNLSALRERLAVINDCAEKVKKFKEMKVKSPVKTPNKQSSTPIKCYSSPPIKAIQTPKKTPTKSVTKKTVFSPTYRRRLFDIYDESSNTDAKVDETNTLFAFEKFNYLTIKQESCSLRLPYKYKSLSEAFQSVDYVVSMLYKRHELCTFSKLKQSVEGMTRRSFEVKQLTQIHTVFPDAFTLKYECLPSSSAKCLNSNGFQLIITGNYGSNLGANHLTDRYNLFTNKLLDIVKRHHKQYLNSLDVPIDIDCSQLRRWHPKFKLDEVPDIEPNDNSIPKLPTNSNKQTVEGFLETSRQKLGIPDDKAVDNNNKDQIDNQSSPSKITKGVLKGLSTELLHKIRAKEASILAHEMTRKPEVERELNMIKRFPEVIRIIHSYFISEKKSALPYDQVVNKIIDSYHSSIAVIDVKNHIDYLSKLLPDWIYIVNVKKGSYVKMEKNKSILQLIEIINKREKHLKVK